MAVEYQTRRYWFKPNENAACHSDKPPRTPVAFVFNYYHDLESIFWVFLYYIFTHVSLFGEGTDETLKDLMEEWVRLFEITDGKSTDRLKSITTTPPTHWVSLFWRTKWYTSVWPLAYCPLQVHSVLRLAYRALEANEPEDGAHWDEGHFSTEVYETFLDAFQAALNRTSELSRECTEATHVSDL